MSSPKLKWYNLLENKCPKCGKGVELHTTMGEMIVCKAMECDFKVTAQRMQEICSDIENKRINRTY